MPTPINSTFIIVVKLQLAGAPVLGLTTGSFAAGDLLMRFVDHTAPSPPEISLTPVTDYTVEELHPGKGIYAFKFPDTLLTAVGEYSVVFYKPATFDQTEGVIKTTLSEITDELLWLTGQNTVGIVAAYDDNGQATVVHVYGFDTKADAELFSTNPSAYVSLVKFSMEERYTYDVASNRVTKYIRKRLT